jgi:hypothetical protein
MSVSTDTARAAARTRVSLPLALMLALLPATGLAAEQRELLDLTNHWAGYLGVAVFVVAYLLVMAEEFTHLRKSKPVILAAGLIWAVVAWVYQANGYTRRPSTRCARTCSNTPS